jgi:hypothetical protein
MQKTQQGPAAQQAALTGPLQSPEEQGDAEHRGMMQECHALYVVLWAGWACSCTQ